MEVVILLSAQRQAFPCLGDVQQHDPLIGRQARVRHLGARPAICQIFPVFVQEFFLRSECRSGN